MRLLLFSDLHADADAARRLVAMARSAEVLVGAGGFANARRGIDVCVDVLRELALPAVLVGGNSELAEELAGACSRWPSARVLHGTAAEAGGLVFFGLGGGVPPTPFGPWS